jgi:hypothetical protein
MPLRANVRTGLVIVIVLLAVVLVILMVNLLPLLAVAETPTQPRRILRQEVTSAVSLVGAADRAAERARNWTEEAELVRVEAAWYITPGWERYSTPPVAWAFLYYSPETGELASVIIDDSDVLWSPPIEIPVRPRPLDEFPPGWGADVAWLAFLASEGQAFLQEHPASQVTFRLQMREGMLTWTVSAQDGNHYLSAKINAGSGSVIP